MRLKNKSTGDLGNLCYEDGVFMVRTDAGCWQDFSSLEKLTEEWEDYEERKEYWCIDWTGGINQIIVIDDTNEFKENKKEIGNYFKTQEEAEKAVKKLKAWKRLKDAGFKFEGVAETWFGGGRVGPMSIQFNKHDDDVWIMKHHNDLELLFGGEE